MPAYVLSAADGSEYPIGSTVMQIGRESTCQIMLGDPLVSRLHVTLWVEQDELYVRDEFSSNGAYVNEALIEPTQPRHLHIGDQLRVGHTTFSVKYARVTGNLPPTPPRRVPGSAAEQTDIGFSIPRLATARPTLPVVPRHFPSWVYSLIVGLAIAVALAVITGLAILAVIFLR